MAQIVAFANSRIRLILTFGVGIAWPVYVGLAAAVVLIAGVAMVGSARV